MRSILACQACPPSGVGQAAGRDLSEAGSRVSGCGVPPGTVKPERTRAGTVHRDLYHVLDRPGREAAKLQIPIMEPRWREFFTRRRQRSPAAGQAGPGGRMVAPRM